MRVPSISIFLLSLVARGFASVALGNYEGEWKSASVRVVVKTAKAGAGTIDIFATSPLLGSIIQGTDLPFSLQGLRSHSPVAITIDREALASAMQSSTKVALLTGNSRFMPENVSVEYYPLGKDGLTRVPMIKVTVTLTGRQPILRIEAELDA